MVTGILQRRDISVFLLNARSSVAQHFAADTGSARFAIGHHLPGVVTMATPRPFMTWEWRRGPCDAQAGTAHALDALDHRATGVVLQGDFDSSTCRLRS